MATGQSRKGRDMRKERVRRMLALMARAWNKGRSTKKKMLSLMRKLHMRKKV